MGGKKYNKIIRSNIQRRRAQRKNICFQTKTASLGQSLKLKKVDAFFIWKKLFINSYIQAQHGSQKMALIHQISLAKIYVGKRKDKGHFCE